MQKAIFINKKTIADAMNKQDREEYYVLTEKLDELTWALEGKCNDIDCNKYMYKELLRKKYKPILEHNFSCRTKLKREKDAVMRLLTLKKFKKFRYKNCDICKRQLDSLGEKYSIVSFTKPIKHDGKLFYEWKGISVHRECRKRVKTPEGWTKF